MKRRCGAKAKLNLLLWGSLLVFVYCMFIVAWGTH